MDARKRPFTEFERSLLINLIAEYANIIEKKKTVGSTMAQKATAWASITEKYNASSMVTRKVETKQLRKFWNNFKAKSRDSKTIENQSTFLDGRLSVPDLNEEHVSVAPNILSVLKVAYRDDVEEDNDDSYHWTEQKSCEEENIVKEEILDPTSSSTASDSMTGPSMAANTTPRPSSPINSARHQRGLKRSIDNLKKKILEQDLQNRKEKFKIEMEHLKKIQLIELEQKTMELDHKKKMFELYEQELRAKIDSVKYKN